jgi:formamidopyrimidine-DNA glycosylase
VSKSAQGVRTLPELPEVEVVRRGLDAHVVGRAITSVVVHEVRSLRGDGGREQFGAQLSGRTITAAHRRGKYLWLALDGTDAVLCHLGMSGQLRISVPDNPPERHLRISLGLDDGSELRFVDQRIFGRMSFSRDGAELPGEISHIARDPLDDQFDAVAFSTRLRRRRTGIKRALLDQSLISGIGNIYADESLWRSCLHGERLTSGLRRADIDNLLENVRDVMTEALAAGGTSFDALYVNVNGQSGYFDRSLAVYGRQGEPCDRCGAPIRRTSFMNRSSYWCAACQPAPRSVGA